MQIVSSLTLTPQPEAVAAALRARRIRRAIGGSSAVSDRLAELAFGALPQGWPVATSVSAANG